MAQRCEICGKGPAFGRNISHAHNVSPRRFNPNLQTVRAVVNGGHKRVRVCTRCIRSNKVTKAA
jgi:large subunit ribosomal protein L28